MLSKTHMKLKIWWQHNELQVPSIIIFEYLCNNHGQDSTTKRETKSGWHWCFPSKWDFGWNFQTAVNNKETSKFNKAESLVSMAVSVCSTRTIELFLFEMKHCIHCLNSRRAVNTALALEQMHGEKHKSIPIKKTNYSNTLTVTLLQKSVQFSITLYFYSTWPHHDQPKRTGSMSQAQTPSYLKADLGDICSTPSVYFLPFSPCSSWCLTENP